MRNFLRNFVAAAGIALSVLATASLSYAQVAPSGQTQQRRPVPRYSQQQFVHYVRTTFAFNSCTLVSNTCTVQLMNASLPYNAVVLRVTAVLYTTFNSATTDTFTLGTTAASANEIVTACNIHAAGQIGCTLATVAANATGGTAAQTGFNGGFDLFLKYSQTGAAPTAGLMAVVIEYIAPNDGTCAPVPLGSTAPGC